jgi:hypothetical protein
MGLNLVFAENPFRDFPSDSDEISGCSYPN